MKIEKRKTLKRTPSRTDLEKWDRESIIRMFGVGHFIEASIKAMSPHDSDRNVRRRKRVEKRRQKVEKQRAKTAKKKLWN